MLCHAHAEMASAGVEPHLLPKRSGVTRSWLKPRLQLEFSNAGSITSHPGLEDMPGLIAVDQRVAHGIEGRGSQARALGFMLDIVMEFVLQWLQLT